MTIAVCIKCGEEKFGAFTACKRCLFEPSNVLELAKSLYLSDHNFPKDRLDAFGLTIAVGEPIEYDPIALTIIATPLSHEYYCKSRCDSSGRLPCIRCGTIFLSQDDSATCPDCERLLNSPLSTCASCILAFDGAVKYCSRCGRQVSALGSTSPRTIAQSAAFHAHLLKVNQRLLDSSELLTLAVNRLTTFDRQRYEQELEILVLYASILTLRDVVVSSTTCEVVSRAVLQIFCDSFLLYGLSHAESEARVHRFLDRFDEYDKALSESTNQPILGLAIDAMAKLFPTEDKLELAFDLVILIGAYLKYSKELLLGNGPSGIGHSSFANRQR